MQQHYYKFWKDLIVPQSYELDRGGEPDSYGRFRIEPLDKGYGVTLGNSLRRVLLSSMMGSAVSAVKIEGVLHEFSTIPDVMEDVTDVLLNLKQVRFKHFDSEPVTLTLKKSGPGVITAGDIEASNRISVLNPDQHIATLGKDAKFEAELFVSFGRGYAPAESHDHNLPVGFMALDCLYSPVKKVNYKISNARVGQRTDFDSLDLEVWTDKSLKPEEAVSLAAKILAEQLKVFMDFEEDFEPKPEVRSTESPEINPYMFRPVEVLELSVRSANCLKNANIKFIGELVTRSEHDMLRTKNFGRKSLNEIKEILITMGLDLGMEVEGWPPPGWDPNDPQFQPDFGETHPEGQAASGDEIV